MSNSDQFSRNPAEQHREPAFESKGNQEQGNNHTNEWEEDERIRLNLALEFRIKDEYPDLPGSYIDIIIEGLSNEIQRRFKPDTILISNNNTEIGKSCLSKADTNLLNKLIAEVRTEIKEKREKSPFLWDYAPYNLKRKMLDQCEDFLSKNQPIEPFEGFKLKSISSWLVRTAYPSYVREQQISFDPYFPSEDDINNFLNQTDLGPILSQLDNETQLAKAEQALRRTPEVIELTEEQELSEQKAEYIRYFEALHNDKDPKSNAIHQIITREINQMTEDDFRKLSKELIENSEEELPFVYTEQVLNMLAPEKVLGWISEAQEAAQKANSEEYLYNPEFEALRRLDTIQAILESEALSEQRKKAFEQLRKMRENGRSVRILPSIMNEFNLPIDEHNTFTLESLRIPELYAALETREEYRLSTDDFANRFREKARDERKQEQQDTYQLIQELYPRNAVENLVIDVLQALSTKGYPIPNETEFQNRVKAALSAEGFSTSDLCYAKAIFQVVYQNYSEDSTPTWINNIPSAPGIQESLSQFARKYLGWIYKPKEKRGLVQEEEYRSPAALFEYQLEKYKKDIPPDEYKWMRGELVPHIIQLEGLSFDETVSPPLFDRTLFYEGMRAFLASERKSPTLFSDSTKQLLEATRAFDHLVHPEYNKIKGELEQIIEQNASEGPEARWMTHEFLAYIDEILRRYQVASISQFTTEPPLSDNVKQAKAAITAYWVEECPLPMSSSVLANTRRTLVAWNVIEEIFPNAAILEAEQAFKQNRQSIAEHEQERTAAGKLRNQITTFIHQKRGLLAPREIKLLNRVAERIRAKASTVNNETNQGIILEQITQEVFGENIDLQDAYHQNAGAPTRVFQNFYNQFSLSFSDVLVGSPSPSQEQPPSNPSKAHVLPNHVAKLIHEQVCSATQQLEIQEQQQRQQWEQPIAKKIEAIEQYWAQNPTELQLLTALNKAVRRTAQFADFAQKYSNDENKFTEGQFQTMLNEAYGQLVEYATSSGTAHEGSEMPLEFEKITKEFYALCRYIGMSEIHINQLKNTKTKKRKPKKRKELPTNYDSTPHSYYEVNNAKIQELNTVFSKNDTIRRLVSTWYQGPFNREINMAITQASKNKFQFNRPKFEQIITEAVVRFLHEHAQRLSPQDKQKLIAFLKEHHDLDHIQESWLRVTTEMYVTTAQGKTHRN